MKEKAVFIRFRAKVSKATTDKISMPCDFAAGTDYSINAYPENIQNLYQHGGGEGPAKLSGRGSRFGREE